MLTVETFLREKCPNENMLTWKRFFHRFCPRRQISKKGSTWECFFGRGDVDTFPVPIPQDSTFGSSKPAREERNDVETFPKRFHVGPVDTKSWRRGNVVRNVSTSGGNPRRGNVLRNVEERCLTWKRFGPKGAWPVWMDSVLGGWVLA